MICRGNSPIPIPISEMALETPTWLNLCFMEKILRRSENDNSIHVIDIFTKPATSTGDNYTSDMLRVNIEYSRDQNDLKIKEKKSVIIKMAPTIEGARKTLVLQARLFETEIIMMRDTLDKMNKLLDYKHRLSGKALYAQENDPAFIVMEDLAPLSYRMACRHSRLDLTHSLLALRGLARFHATSIALLEKEPNLKQIHFRGMFFKEAPPEMAGFFIMSANQLAKEMENWPGMKKYSEKVAKLVDHIYEIGVEAFKYSEDEFNVINHGDCWVNNMMFKYSDDGKPIGHIFVDFQLCVYTSATVDLIYFLTTSPSIDVIENKKDILLTEYLDTLSATMKQLGCKTQQPTLQELNDSMKRRLSFEMIVTFTVLPLTMVDQKEAKDLDNILSKDGYTNPGYKNEVYKKLVMNKIPIYDKLGLLDL